MNKNKKTSTHLTRDTRRMFNIDMNVENTIDHGRNSYQSSLEMTKQSINKTINRLILRELARFRLLGNGFTGFCRLTQPRTKKNSRIEKQPIEMFHVQFRSVVERSISISRFCSSSSLSNPTGTSARISPKFQGMILFLNLSMIFLRFLNMINSALFN